MHNDKTANFSPRRRVPGSQIGRRVMNEMQTGRDHFDAAKLGVDSPTLQIHAEMGAPRSTCCYQDSAPFEQLTSDVRIHLHLHLDFLMWL